MREVLEAENYEINSKHQIGNYLVTDISKRRAITF